MSDDDESPWISMDETINENSSEIQNKSPTTYSKPNTPEIDKLKSLIVSSPSISSSDKSNESFYEKLQEYYDLKQQYDQKLRDAHTQWNNSKPPMSLEKKKENYQNFMMNRKCINCNKGPGGTIFSQVGIGETRRITAICGCEDKCNLNIEIYMGETIYIPENLDYHKQNVEELKRELTEYKLDLLFNLRDEEEVLAEFRTIKEQLTENLDQLCTMKIAFDKQNEEIELGQSSLEIFKFFEQEVTPNEEGEYVVNRKKYIEIMQKHLNNLISQFKTKTLEYKKEPTREKLKDNFEFLVNEIQEVQNSIREEKYHIIYMDTTENSAKKGFKKQKMMDTYTFNPSKYSLDNLMVTMGAKITEFER